jgi:hypothetical protein
LVEVCRERLIKNATTNLGLVIYGALRRSIISMLTLYLYSENEEDIIRKNHLRHFLFLCEKKIEENQLIIQT